MCIPGFGGIARTPMAPSTQREVSCSRGTWWRTAAVETSPPSLCPRLRASGHGEAENQREEMSDHSCKPRAKTCNQSARRQQQPKVGSTRLNAVSRHARLQVCRRKFKRLPLPRTHACRGIPEIRAALSPHGLASHCTAKVPSGVLRPLFWLAHAREVREVGVGEDNRGASRISKRRRTDRPTNGEGSFLIDFCSPSLSICFLDA